MSVNDQYVYFHYLKENIDRLGTLELVSVCEKLIPDKTKVLKFKVNHSL